jgi:hypothetical protein
MSETPELRRIPGFSRYFVDGDMEVYGLIGGSETQVARLPLKLRQSGQAYYNVRRDGSATSTTIVRHRLLAAAGVGSTAAPPEGARPLLEEPGYFITPDGRVYSTVKYEGCRELAQSPNPGGYLTVSVRGKTRNVHLLVLRNFRGEKPSPAHEGRHVDGRITNNHESNLVWSTHQENMDDRALHGTVPVGESHGLAKLNDSTVRDMRALYDGGGWTYAGLGESME